MTLASATFAERVRLARMLKGLSQAELGAALQCPYETICRWENGRSKPTPRGSRVLAKALGVSLGWLLLGDAAQTTLKDMAAGAEQES